MLDFVIDDGHHYGSRSTRANSLHSAASECDVRLGATEEQTLLPRAKMDAGISAIRKMGQSLASSFTDEAAAGTSLVAMPSAAVSFTTSPAALAAAPVAGTPFVLVVDPLSRKIAIPRVSIRDTLAMTRPGIPSLCLLSLSNKCRQGSQCHQIHADPNVVIKLRAEAKAQPTCCAAHGDVNSACMRPEWLVRRVIVNGVELTGRQLAFTSALQKLLTESPDSSSPIVVPGPLICRLHGGARCRYSDDCRFIHVCRDVLKHELAGHVDDLVPVLEIRHSGGTAPTTAQQTRRTSINTSTTHNSMPISLGSPAPGFSHMPATMMVPQPAMAQHHMPYGYSIAPPQLQPPMTAGGGFIFSTAPDGAHPQLAAPAPSYAMPQSLPPWMYYAPPSFVGNEGATALQIAPPPQPPAPDGGYVLLPLQHYQNMMGQYHQQHAPATVPSPQYFMMPQHHLDSA